MGKSLRSKRMRRNRREKRVVNAPRVKAKLISALNFEYNDQTEKAHLSIFHEAMNGPPPAVPGLEPGSKLERTHLTLAHETQDGIKALLQRRSNRKIAEAVKALTGVTSLNPECKRDKALLDQMEEKAARDAQKQTRYYNPKTQRDQFGNYPEWMPDKKVRSIAHANKVRRKKLQRRKSAAAKRVKPVTDIIKQVDNEKTDVSEMECEKPPTDNKEQDDNEKTDVPEMECEPILLP